MLENKFNFKIYLKNFFLLQKNKLKLSYFIFIINIYGINKFTSKIICKLNGISTTLKLNRIDEELLKLVYYNFIKKIVKLLIFDIKKENIEKLKNIKNYKGWRHIFNLPVNGQRSHTNAKTRRKYNIF